MNLPNFHDGSFDGFRIYPDKSVQWFLRTADQHAFTLSFQVVRAMNLSEVREGNIIFEVVVRNAQQLTIDDVREVYGHDSPQVERAFTLSQEQNLQLLEMNPSYGAEGLILFETFEINPGS